jgi:putative phosphoserine phosphatase/1-acylglycerol-3-phosphate O-acyltransferase
MRVEGKSVCLSPEGTRTIGPRLSEFKKGAFHLAMQAGVPMIPIVIHNSGDVQPKGDFLYHPGTVEVEVLPPIDTSGWTARTVDDHVAEVRGLFLTTLGQKLPPKIKPATATWVEAETRTEVETKARPKVETKARPKVETKTKPKARPKAKTKAKPKSKPKAKPKSKAKPQPEARANPQPKAKAKARTRGTPRPQKKVNGQSTKTTVPDAAAGRARE